MTEGERPDLEADLSKKQRLINAWVAVGPEGTTTDVSDLTDSSSGYASDIRRALEGEGDQTVDAAELREAFDPALVDAYRSELDEEAIEGQWGFETDLRGDEQGPATDSAGTTGDTQATSRSATQSTAGGGSQRATTDQQPDQRMGGRVSASGSQPTRGGHQSTQAPQQPAPGGEPQGQQGQQPSQRASQVTPQSAVGTGQQPRQPPAGTSQQPAAGSGQHPPGGTAQHPPAGTGQQTAAGSTQQRARGPQQAAASPQTPGGQQPPQQGLPGATAEQMLTTLQDLDASLAAAQQDASSEVYGCPAGSQARSIAVSKYNLVTDLRQSLSELAGTVQRGRQNW